MLQKIANTIFTLMVNKCCKNKSDLNTRWLLPIPLEPCNFNWILSFFRAILIYQCDFCKAYFILEGPFHWYNYKILWHTSYLNYRYFKQTTNFALYWKDTHLNFKNVFQIRDPNAPKKKRGAIEYDPEGDSCTRILEELKRRKAQERYVYYSISLKH